MFDLRQFAALSPEWYLRLHYHEDLDSTNDEAHRLADSGAEHGSVVLADHQQQGRGRRGASWVSERGDSLLFSILLRPDFPKNHWSRIALATGLGIVSALKEKWHVQAKIKWPNDIYLRNGKCAGILVEARDDYVVVGVGLNVFSSPGNTESTIPTIALSDVIPEEKTTKPISRERVFVDVLDSVIRETDACDVDFVRQLKRLRDACYLTGKAVRFKASGNSLLGVVTGIDDDGSLRVEVQGVEKSFAQASEIRVV